VATFIIIRWSSEALGMGLKRKFLAARADLTDVVSAIAQERHLTLFGIVNEALQQVIRAGEVKQSISEVMDAYMVLKTARETGSLVISEDLWYPMLERAFSTEKEALLKAWHEQGRWYGKVFPAKFPGEDPVKVAEKVLQALLWGTSEVALLASQESMTVRCIGPRFTEAYTMLLASFLEGVAESLGYAVERRDVSRGVILITFGKPAMVTERAKAVRERAPLGVPSGRA